jgi:hypothetical protein
MRLMMKGRPSSGANAEILRQLGILTGQNDESQTVSHRAESSSRRVGMLKKKDVPYYRRREEAELERAVRAESDAARKAHLRLADMYHEELKRRQRMRNDLG